MHFARTYTGLILALLMTGTATAATPDLALGKTLHDSACKTCHQPDIYTRKDRKIHSSAELTRQVTRCQAGAGEHWSASQIEDVAAYLNATYYKFK